MPVFLTLNGDNKGTIADTVVINNYPTHTAQPQRREVEDVVPVQEEPTTTTDSTTNQTTKPNFAEFESYLSVAYYQKREAEYNAVLDLICNPDYSDREKAYFALVIYQTSGIMKTTKRPKTYAAWYKVFCDIFHLKHHSDYNPEKLLPASDKAKIIETYVYTPVYAR